MATDDFKSKTGLRENERTLLPGEVSINVEDKDDKPEALSAQFTDRLRESLRPRDFSDLPGTEIIAAAGIPPGKIQSLDTKYRALYLELPNNVPFAMLSTYIGAYGGRIAQTPFSEPGEKRILIIFPNEANASNAALSIKANWPTAKIGLQRAGTLISAGIIKRKPVFVDNGIDSALRVSETVEIREFKDTAEAMPQCGNEQQKQSCLDAVRQIPETITKVGAVAEVRLPDYLKSAAGQREKILREILDVIDSKTDEFEWIGNTLRIVSTREGAAGILAVRLQEIINSYEGINMQVVISEGELEVLDLLEKKGKTFPPRTLRSKAFAARNIEIPGIDECRSGVFVDDVEFKRLDTPRGIKIEQYERYGNLIKLTKFQPRTTELMTGGPREMIGREEEWRKLLKIAPDVTACGEYRIMILNGEPGSGKSRFMEETIRYFRGKKAEVFYSKANEYESTKSFNFIKRVVSEILKKTTGQSDSPEYKLLSAFVSEGEEEAQPQTKSAVEKMHKDVAYLISLIKTVVNGSGNIFAGFTDDLQWCDNESAIILASLIRTFGPNDKVFLQLSARSDYQTIPYVIRRALGEMNAASVSMTPLDFKGNDYALLKEYILKSLPIAKEEGKTLPLTFLANLSKASDGNPFAVTQILYDLQEKGLLYIDESDNVVVREAEIDFTDYTGEALYENRLQRLSEDEKLVFKALVLFEGRVGMTLFKTIFPDIVPHVHKLETHGLIDTKPYLKIRHDLLAQAAKKKFPKDPSVAWELFGKVNLLIRDSEFRNQISHEIIFGILTPVLENPDSIGADNQRSLYAYAVIYGLAAVDKIIGQYRTKEASELLAEIDRLIGLKHMSDGQLFQVKLHQARLSLNTEQGKRSIESLREAEYLAGKIGRLPGDRGLELDLRILECDAYHMTRDGKSLEIATAALERLYDVISNQGGKQLEGRETLVGILPAMIALNRAKASFHNRQFEEALDICKKLIRTTVADIDAAPQNTANLEAEQMALEVRRFFANLTMVVEEAIRNRLDEDTVLAQNPPINAKTREALKTKQPLPEKIPQDKIERQKSLDAAVQTQLMVVRNYRKNQLLMRHPKDLISALAALAKLCVYSGTDNVMIEGNKFNSSGLMEEAIREAANYGEIAMIAYLQKIMGGMHLRHPKAEQSRMRVESSISCYKAGMQEMLQTRDGENHYYYAANACDAARAIVIWVKNFGEASPEEAKAKIEEGWRHITHAYKFFYEKMGAQTVAESILPFMGSLVKLGQKYKVETPLPSEPQKINTGLVSVAETIRDEKETAARNVEECVRKETERKKEGIETLKRMFSPFTETPPGGEDASAENLELDLGNPEGE